MSKKIYVGNLNFSTTEEILKNEFSKYGEVILSVVIKDRNTGLSKGFGFIEMEDDTESLNAISSLNGKMIEGRRVRVNVAEDKPRDFAPRGERRNYEGSRGGFENRKRRFNNEY